MEADNRNGQPNVVAVQENLIFQNVSDATPEIVSALYEMLRERLAYPDSNISHRSLPSMLAHQRFVAGNPYKAWYIIVSDGQYIGNAYISKQNEIGIFISKKWRGQGHGKTVVRWMMEQHRLPSYLANINPKNEASIKFFESFGFKHIQNTYESPIDCVAGILKHSSEKLDHRNVFASPDLLEGYLANEICICLKLGTRLSKSNGPNYYAVFSNFPGPTVTESYDDRLFAVSELGGDLGILSDCHLLTGGSQGADDRQELVFIKVVLFLDAVQQRIIWRPVRSLVRLYREDEFFGGRRDALYQSSITGRLEFLSRGADGELVPRSWDAALFSNQGAEQVVETGPEMVDNFSGEYREAWRDNGIAKRYESILKPIILMAGRKTVWFGITGQEIVDFPVKILDVFFGPLHFCKAACEQVGHGTRPENKD